MQGDERDVKNGICTVENFRKSISQMGEKRGFYMAIWYLGGTQATHNEWKINSILLDIRNKFLDGGSHFTPSKLLLYHFRGSFLYCFDDFRLVYFFILHVIELKKSEEDSAHLLWMAKRSSNAYI